MATEIQTWEIIEGQLKEINTTLSECGRKEKEDLEQWLKTETKILGEDIRIIGEQVYTASGPLDYLGLDDKGNLVIVELKREKLPREVLAQAIDYASDISSWELDKISEVCISYTGQSLEDFISENFEDIDADNFTVNESQRILLVGFSIESSLIRMIEWLSDKYDLAINAIVLKYTKTSSGNELISKTSIIPEEIEKTKVNKKKYKIEMSDEVGDYSVEELRSLFSKYLKANLWSSRRIREIMLPFLIENKDVVTREKLKQEFLKVGGELGGEDPKQAGIYIAIISNQLGQKKKDYLRQVIQYEYPNFSWEKDNFKINPNYYDMVKEILEEIRTESIESSARIY